MPSPMPLQAQSEVQTSNIPSNSSSNSTTISNSTSQEIAPYYPPNNGAIQGTEEAEKYLMPGDLVDRYGGVTPTSRYLSPVGTPIEARALPPSVDLSLHDVYQVVKPFPVGSSIVSPYYGSPGLGTQYVTPVPISVLSAKGIIIKITIPLP